MRIEKGENISFGELLEYLVYCTVMCFIIYETFILIKNASSLSAPGF